eukprot:TRINITY_DN28127_c0_g1_i1.p1 TRINITY_DN28127_c0_g1~~TRINITY_DN28127_c0_g1_i1.p1  ORF type:complete len:407 (+),score=141.44 TRINITY_DN28127_c0_g1_i1:160-1380(+)
MHRKKNKNAAQFTPDDFLIPARPPALKKNSEGLALVYACSLGQFEKVQALLKTIPPYHTVWGMALRKAAANGHTEIVKAMVDSAKGTRHRGIRWDSVLYEASKAAAQRGHDDALAALLQRGAPLVMIGAETALQSAARAGQAHTAHTLLAAGADPGSFDLKKTDTPMALARQQNKPAVAHALRKWAAAEAKTGWGTAINPRHETVRRAQTARLATGRAMDKAAMTMPPPKLFSPPPPVQTLGTVQQDEMRARGKLSTQETAARGKLVADFEKNVPSATFSTAEDKQRAAREFQQLRRRSTARRLSRARSSERRASQSPSSADGDAHSLQQSIAAFNQYRASRTLDASEAFGAGLKPAVSFMEESPVPQAALTPTPPPAARRSASFVSFVAPTPPERPRAAEEAEAL